MRKLIFVSAMLFAVFAVVWAKEKEPARVTVSLTNGQGQSVGTATLSPADHGVAIKLNLHGLPAGDHAIHVHQTAKCEGPDFKSAGGHFNPDNKHHGLQNPDGPHAGDIPNFVADVKGKAKTTVVAANVTMGDDPHSIFTGGEPALGVHANADDGKTAPTRNSGDPLACGVINK